jgi:hypothetical protein
MMEKPVSTTPVRAAAARDASARPSPRYWVGLGILVLSAAATQVLPGVVGVFFQKEAVPLRRPLAHFDAGNLGPRYARHRATDRIPPMSEDMVESLGTEDYLQIYLADMETPKSDVAHVAHVFVSYYTGKPDMVPHVPDECYLAVGYDPLGASTVSIPAEGPWVQEGGVPIRMVRFRAPQHRRTVPGQEEVAVTYFFHVNGGFATTRNGVRVILSNPFQRYAYYSKIEISFTDDTLSRSASPEVTARALVPLLEAIMPVLIEDHFDLSKFASAPAAAPTRK